MTDYSKLLERLASERYAYSFGRPSDQEIAAEQLAEMAVFHIQALVETVQVLRAKARTIKSIADDLRIALSEADHLSGFNDYKALQVLANAVCEALSQLRK